MTDLSKIAAIIPTFNPDEKIIGLCHKLKDAGFGKIIVVNDGSGKDKDEIFNKLKENSIVRILSHEENKGKGRGLKTAFSYALTQKDIEGVVTMDDDGQHKVTDAVAVALKMQEKNAFILGCRDFDGEKVPPKSKMGNKFTCFLFRAFFNLNITDTQTGLRAIPKKYLSSLIKLEGERFEYETNVLLSLRKLKIPYEEVKIETVYIEDNKSTHFNPFKDSFKIMWLIFKFAVSSLLSFGVDIFMYSVMLKLLKAWVLDRKIFAATITARVISSIFNYTVNRKAVFSSDTPVFRSIVLYYLLAIVIMLLSFAGTFLLTHFFGHAVIMKVVTDLILFVLSFKVQKKIIF